jgi:hypothetical protein
MTLRTPILWLAAVCFLSLPQHAGAFGSGISSGVLGPLGCNTCHGSMPGTLPAVSLTGPTIVTAGSSNVYTFIITSPPGQPDGGFTASSLLGDLTVGGPDAAMTAIVPSGGGNNAVTHSARKPGSGGEVRFSFLWEAPLAAGPASLDVWGNAVNGDATALGDGATFASLAVTVEAGPPAPVPATSPWAQGGLVALLLGAGALFVLRRRSR